MKTLFEAHDLCRRYGDLTALYLPFFSMEKGETVVLTGRNGSGKSTLLRLLAFLEKPTSGTLFYGGNAADPRREITLLLLDEPTSNVDEASEKAILNVVRSLHEREVSVICATHDRDIPAALGAREVGIVGKRP